MGRDFWLGFMVQEEGLRFPFDNNKRALEVFISADTDVSGTIEILGEGRVIPFNVTGGFVHREVIFFGISRNDAVAIKGSGNIEQKALHISADADIGVQALALGGGSCLRISDLCAQHGEVSTVLPTGSLGSKYYISTYLEPHSPGDPAGLIESFTSNFLIVAIADDTDIRIKPTVPTLDGKEANESFTVSLNRGDMYQLISFEDLTGTLVESVLPDDCKPFAVFTGTRETRVTGEQNCAADNPNTNQIWAGGAGDNSFFEQLRPVSGWGMNYVALPFETRPGYMLQITASENNTRVSLSDGTDFVLNSGESAIRELGEAVQVNADKPIQVAQMTKSVSCDFPAFSRESFNSVSTAGPMMIMLADNDRLSKHTRFVAMNAGSTVLDRYFVNILIRTDQASELFFEGARLPESMFRLVPGGEYAFVTVEIEQGSSYVVESADGFLAYMYAFVPNVSIGFMTGISKPEIMIEAYEEVAGEIEEKACLGSQIEFKPVMGDEVRKIKACETFIWDFGDGSMGEGEVVSHTYNVAGSYEVKLAISNGFNTNDEIIERNIEIVEAVADEIIGTTSVCPGVMGIQYEVAGSEENSYEWSVSGGTIKGSNSERSVLVDWEDANDEASLTVIPTNSLGCVGAPLTLNIRINKRLEPMLANGPAELCFSNLKNVAYSTPFTNGSEYQWFIEGGIIISGRNTNEVIVDWNPDGPRELWYQEYNPLIAECEGVSPRLAVQVYSDIVQEAVIDHVTCYGGNDGSINLTISGGKPGPYEVDWSNGMEGSTISGLLPGNYTAKIRDVLGCEKEAAFVITEPEELTAQVMLIDVMCHGGSDGMAELIVSGGTAPFRIFWNGSNTDGGHSIETLSKGEHSVKILDRYDCEITLQFEIDEPDPLSAQTIDTPTCPGQSTGTILVEASGGTPPYTYRWNTSPPQDKQLIEGLPAGSYSVTVTDHNGCTFTFPNEEIEERFPLVRLPNAFSPNGDGENDTFYAINECVADFEMKIYSKWGEILFSTKDISKGWDGIYKGKEVPAGPYTYVIQYAATVQGATFSESVRGVVNVLR